MSGLILRKAAKEDMEDILQLQVDIFHGEQNIPSELVPLSEEKTPQWWSAVKDNSVVGAVAAWNDNNQIHWGRFVTRPDLRGLHIGTRLAQFSLDDLFSQQIEDVYMEARDVTVKIICKMGGKIIGEPFPFYEGTVTPMIIKKSDFVRLPEA